MHRNLFLKIVVSFSNKEAKFAEFVEKTSAEKHRKEFYTGEHDSHILGDDRFVVKVLPQKPSVKSQVLI